MSAMLKVIAIAFIKALSVYSIKGRLPTHPKDTIYGCWVSPLTRFIGLRRVGNLLISIMPGILYLLGLRSCASG
jgi:hypothetical protein